MTPFSRDKREIGIEQMCRLLKAREKLNLRSSTGKSALGKIF